MFRGGTHGPKGVTQDAIATAEEARAGQAWRAAPPKERSPSCIQAAVRMVLLNITLITERGTWGLERLVFDLR